MSIPVLLSIFITLFFGILAIFFSMKEEKILKILIEREKKQKQRLYEIGILKEVQDRIGYALDITKVVEVITGSLRNLFPYSTSSYLLIKRGKLWFSVYAEESISHAYVQGVKEKMLQSFKIIHPIPLPIDTTEKFYGVALDDANPSLLASYFQIPVVVNDTVVGLITISSTKDHAFTKDEMIMLYQITGQATNALGKLQTVLTTEKEKLTAMVSSLGDSVFMVDMNRQLLMINPSAVEQLQLKNPDLTIVDVLSAIPRQYELGGKIDQAIAENKRVDIKEATINQKIFQISITPVHNPEKIIDTEYSWKIPSVIGAAILMHDITLEKSVAQMKEDFTHMMVHELRSPLTAIKAASSMLVFQDEKLNKEEKDKILHLIDEQARKLLDEIAIILDAAKLDSGMFTVKKVKGDMEKLIEEKITFFKAQAQNKQISLTADITGKLPLLCFDTTYIAQVLNNLLSNSLKFTNPGGKITIRAFLKAGTMIVSVSDNGIGIPKEKQGMLFAKFMQVGKSDQNIGTGLGLYIVKGIVQAHGGNVTLESQVGVGTTISFSLPLDPITEEMQIKPKTIGEVAMKQRYVN